MIKIREVIGQSSPPLVVSYATTKFDGTTGSADDLPGGKSICSKAQVQGCWQIRAASVDATFIAMCRAKQCIHVHSDPTATPPGRCLSNNSSGNNGGP